MARGNYLQGWAACLAKDKLEPMGKKHAGKSLSIIPTTHESSRLQGPQTYPNKLQTQSR